MNSKIKVSVVCLCFNHEAYIKKCLEGIIKQKTKFPFDIIVHDDASNDGTVAIVKTFKERFDNLTLIEQKENQWSKGYGITKNFVIPYIKGEYVAFCEGDDYWIDENKLQMQFDYMESHPECSICFHPVKVVWVGTNKKETYSPNKRMLKRIGELSLENLLDKNYIQTNSVFYRWFLSKDNKELIPDNILPGDWYLNLLHAEVGKIHYIDKVMAVYQRHSNGMWTGANQDLRWLENNAQKCLNFYEAIENHFNVSRKKEIGFYNEVIKIKSKNKLNILLDVAENIVKLCFCFDINSIRYIYGKIKADFLYIINN